MTYEKGKVVNLKDTEGRLRKVRSRIYRVGIELEGGWRTPPTDTTIAHDGSVRFSDPVTRVEIVSYPKQRGEIASTPLEVKNTATWVKQYYPTVVNSTCGLHVHMSFASALMYQRLMTPDFPATLLAYMTEWAREEKTFGENHHIWHRLSGKNEYCRDAFWPDEQASSLTKSQDRQAHGHRYTAVNYCYGQHSTVEARFLPMMGKIVPDCRWEGPNPEQAIRAIHRLLDVTSAFLVVTAKRERPEKTVWTVEDDQIKEVNAILV